MLPDDWNTMEAVQLRSAMATLQKCKTFIEGMIVYCHDAGLDDSEHVAELARCVDEIARLDRVRSITVIFGSCPLAADDLLFITKEYGRYFSDPFVMNPTAIVDGPCPDVTILFEEPLRDPPIYSAPIPDPDTHPTIDPVPDPPTDVVVVYDEPGEYEFVNPTSSLLIECWGGGGAGAVNAGAHDGDGGGGGGYGRKLLTVTPGATETIVVGDGGIAIFGGGNGATSYFRDASTVSGTGGTGGGAGGAGGSGTGDVTHSGGTGGQNPGSGGSGGGGGGAAGETGNGSNGGAAGGGSKGLGGAGNGSGGAGGDGAESSTDAVAGTAPGGGGGGGSGARAGQPGAVGRVRITYTAA